MTAAKVKAATAEAAASAALGTTLRIGRFVAPFATPRTWFYATNYETTGRSFLCLLTMISFYTVILHSNFKPKFGHEKEVLGT